MKGFRPRFSFLLFAFVFPRGAFVVQPPTHGSHTRPHPSSHDRLNRTATPAVVWPSAAIERHARGAVAAIVPDRPSEDASTCTRLPPVTSTRESWTGSGEYQGIA